MPCLGGSGEPRAGRAGQGGRRELPSAAGSPLGGREPLKVTAPPPPGTRAAAEAPPGVPGAERRTAPVPRPLSPGKRLRAVINSLISEPDSRAVPGAARTHTHTYTRCLSISTARGTAGSGRSGGPVPAAQPGAVPHTGCTASATRG